MGDLYKQYYSIAKLARTRERRFIHNRKNCSHFPTYAGDCKCVLEGKFNGANGELYGEVAQDLNPVDKVPEAVVLKSESKVRYWTKVSEFVKCISKKTNSSPNYSRSKLEGSFEVPQSETRLKSILEEADDSDVTPQSVTSVFDVDEKTRSIKMSNIDEKDMNGKMDESSSLIRSSDSSLCRELDSLERDELDSIGDSVFSISSTDDDSDPRVSLITKSMELDDRHDLEKVIELNEPVFTDEEPLEDEEELAVGGSCSRRPEVPKNGVESEDSNESKTDSNRSNSQRSMDKKGHKKGEKPEKQVSFDKDDVVILSGSERSYLSDSDVHVNLDGGFSRKKCNSGAKYPSFGGAHLSSGGREGPEDFFPRENKASMKRKEWILKFKKQKQTEKEKESKEADYKTPLQRKDTIIKQLKKELDETYKSLTQKEQEVSSLCDNKNGDGWEMLKEKEAEVSEMRKEVTELKATNVKLQEETANKSEEIEELAAELEKIKREFTERERYHNDMYLKMYEKGQKAAQIERDEQIEELAVKSPEKVTNKELLEKLRHTQSELGRWQSLARRESYDGANRPQTESDAMLQFMKDSMFHYLTDRDDCGVHLRAIVRMLGFSDEEKKRMIQLRKKLKKESGSEFSGLLLKP